MASAAGTSCVNCLFFIIFDFNCPFVSTILFTIPHYFEGFLPVNDSVHFSAFSVANRASSLTEKLKFFFYYFSVSVSLLAVDVEIGREVSCFLFFWRSSAIKIVLPTVVDCLVSIFQVAII